MVSLKSAAEIDVLRTGGKILAGVLEIIRQRVAPGITTRELDTLARELIAERGGEPSFLSYGKPSYPAALCTSVNDQVVHGVPNDYILQEGDIVGLDLGLRYPCKTGLYTDVAITVAVGKISAQAKDLIQVTKQALNIWTNNIKAGRRLNEIAQRVEKYVEAQGFSVVRDLVGHGVGYEVHEDPQIPNYYIENFNLELKEGMVLALEPMVTAGDYRVRTLKDGWTVVTRDHSLCAHFEHTVAVTSRGCEILTQ